MIDGQQTDGKAEAIQRQADEIARDGSPPELKRLADMLDRAAGVLDAGPEFAVAVAIELRRRAAGGA